MSIPDVFSIKTDLEFELAALDTFRHQFEKNRIYRSFCDLLYIHPSDVKSSLEIPFLPIQFFKSHEIISGANDPEIIFTSSGTTSATTSKHSVTNLQLYERSFMSAFTQFYGDPSNYVILALLPSYQERAGSSLIYMVDYLINNSKHKESGYYKDDYFALSEILKTLDTSGRKILLIGVSYALLDLVEQHNFHFKNTIVMETGGMKGRRKEMIRTELHNHLKKGFGVSQIHSEYGMTELLSQAYSNGNGIFTAPPWMKILARDTEDALTLIKAGKTGGINVIDLANQNSCAFIATQDLGKVNVDGSFTVLGRFDNADIRGCNLMAL